MADELTLNITIPVRCAYRPGMRKSKSFFKYADTSVEVTDEEDKHIGDIFGCMGAFLEIAFSKKSQLTGAGEYWHIDPRDVWAAITDARDNLGVLPPIEEEVEEELEEELPIEKEVEEELEEEEEITEQELPIEEEVEEEGETVVWTGRPKKEPGPICYLEITTWVGSSVCAATHYYGKIISGDYKEEVSYVVDKKFAKILNEEDGHNSYHVGDTSERFFDEEHLIECAKQQWRTAFPNAKLLVKGYHNTLDPQEALDGDDAELIAQNNEYWRQFEELIDEEEDQAFEVSRQWRKEFNEKLGIK